MQNRDRTYFQFSAWSVNLQLELERRSWTHGYIQVHDHSSSIVHFWSVDEEHATSSCAICSKRNDLLPNWSLSLLLPSIADKTWLSEYWCASLKRSYPKQRVDSLRWRCNWNKGIMGTSNKAVCWTQYLPNCYLLRKDKPCNWPLLKQSHRATKEWLLKSLQVQPWVKRSICRPWWLRKLGRNVCTICVIEKFIKRRQTSTANTSLKKLFKLVV